MKLATVRVSGEERFGVLADNGFVDLSARMNAECRDIPQLLERDLLSRAAALSTVEPDCDIQDLEFLPVIATPGSRIFALGKAYKDHQLEGGGRDVDYPDMFTKHLQSLVGHRQPLVKPRVSDKYDFEGEIVVVIGRTGRDISESAAMDHVGGYSILMDGTARDWQQHSVTAGKNFEGSSSYGPCLVTRDEIPRWEDMLLVTRLNGIEMQRSKFGMLMWTVPFLVSYISRICTLRPGDAISTGTPGGVGHRRTPPVYMKPGDHLEVEVTGIGTLSHEVIEG